MREIQKDYVSIDNGIEKMIISVKISEVVLNYYTVDYDRIMGAIRYFETELIKENKEKIKNENNYEKE